jgi:uncharacterized damage-inducible protein DinB
MTRRIFGLTVLLVTIIGVSDARLSAAEGDVLGPLRAQWASMRTMMIRIAEVVPEDKYDFKPTPEVRSFREMLTHVITENYFFMSMVTGQKAPDMAPINALKTRPEIIKAMTESYDNGTKILAGLDEAKAMELVPMRNQQTPRWAIVMANIVDGMDHYGNLVVYMRLNGIVPPATADRQKK